MPENESKKESLEQMNLVLKEKMEYEQGILLGISKYVREKHYLWPFVTFKPKQYMWYFVL